MGDMGSRLRLRRSAGARGPIIAVLLLLAAAPLGGTAAWSQSDGSVTVITGGPATATPDAAGAPGSSAPGSSSPASPSATSDGTAISTPGDLAPATTTSGAPGS